MCDDFPKGEFDVLYIGVLALLDRTQGTVLISSPLGAKVEYVLRAVFLKYCNEMWFDTC